jgi:predicted metal-dependent hydrolase
MPWYNRGVDQRDAASGSARECFLTGVDLFNRGEFFEAHEAMEEAMDLAEDDQDWEFFLGLLRAAVANHKLGQSEFSSAVLHLQAALRYLAPYADRHQGLKLREFRYALSVQLARLSEIVKRPGAVVIPSAPQIEFA